MLFLIYFIHLLNQFFWPILAGDPFKLYYSWFTSFLIVCSGFQKLVTVGIWIWTRIMREHKNFLKSRIFCWEWKRLRYSKNFFHNNKNVLIEFLVFPINGINSSRNIYILTYLDIENGNICVSKKKTKK